MSFRSYGLRKTCADIYLKSVVSLYALTSNMVNGPKHSSNLNGSAFTIFIDYCEGNSVWKCLT